MKKLELFIDSDKYWRTWYLLENEEDIFYFRNNFESVPYKYPLEMNKYYSFEINGHYNNLVSLDYILKKIIALKEYYARQEQYIFEQLQK